MRCDGIIAQRVSQMPAAASSTPVSRCFRAESHLGRVCRRSSPRGCCCRRVASGSSRARARAVQRVSPTLKLFVSLSPLLSLNAITTYLHETRLQTRRRRSRAVFHLTSLRSSIPFVFDRRQTSITRVLGAVAKTKAPARDRASRVLILEEETAFIHGL